MRRTVYLAIATLILLPAARAADIPARAKDPVPGSVEAGRVTWLRSYEEATKQAKASGKPILLLFDEIPGCGGCKVYGARVLSHPVVVASAEELFVPLAIRNNARTGYDETIRKKFGMPAWSYPEVRFVDAEGTDVIERAKGDRSLKVLLARMVAALEAAERPVPTWLKLVAAEHAVAKPAAAIFAVPCYWSGDKALGGMDGVLATRIGWLKRREVVEVHYDPDTVSLSDLLAACKKVCGKAAVYARTEAQAEAAEAAGVEARKTDKKIRPEKVQKWHLAHKPTYFLVPMTEAQAARCNAALAARKSPDVYLAPSQIAIKDRLAKAIGADKERAKKLFKDFGVTRSAKELGGYARRLEKVIEELEADGAPADDR